MIVTLLLRSDATAGIHACRREDLFFVQYLWSQIREKEVDDCIDLLKYMTVKVTVLLSYCSSLSDAIKYFKINTTRGLDLEPIDIIKATIWETIPENRHVSHAS